MYVKNFHLLKNYHLLIFSEASQRRQHIFILHINTLLPVHSLHCSYTANCKSNMFYKVPFLWHKPENRTNKMYIHILLDIYLHL